MHGKGNGTRVRRLDSGGGLSATSLAALVLPLALAVPFALGIWVFGFGPGTRPRALREGARRLHSSSGMRSTIYSEPVRPRRLCRTSTSS